MTGKYLNYEYYKPKSEVFACQNKPTTAHFNSMTVVNFVKID